MEIKYVGLGVDILFTSFVICIVGTVKLPTQYLWVSLKHRGVEANQYFSLLLMKKFNHRGRFSLVRLQMLMANSCTFFVKFSASNSLGSLLFVFKQEAKKSLWKDLHCLQSSWRIFLYGYSFLVTLVWLSQVVQSAFCLILIIIYFSITHSGSFFCNVAMASSLCFIPSVLTRWSFVSFLKNKI